MYELQSICCLNGDITVVLDCEDHFEIEYDAVAYST